MSNKIFIICVLLLSSCVSAEKESVTLDNLNYKQNIAATKDLPDDFQTLTFLREKILINQKILEKELKKLEEDRKYLPLNFQEIDSRISTIKRRMSKDILEVESLEKKQDLTTDVKQTGSG